MPGPKLAGRAFTYNGTPNVGKGNKKDSSAAPFMWQTVRFFDSADTGTHTRVPKKVNIPQNSNKGQGVNSTLIKKTAGE
jgi:hypothetical protein